MSQPRNPHTQQYARKSHWIRNTFITTMFIAVGAAAYMEYTYVSPSLDVKNPIINLTPMKAEAAETDINKIDKAKDRIVDEIASKCETRDVKEPDAALLLDTNNEMSIGAFQFQIKTIIHYVKKFDNRDITRVEAIQIAIDHTKAQELARKIVFSEKDGWKNWLNCGNRLDTATKVEIINSL